MSYGIVFLLGLFMGAAGFAILLLTMSASKKPKKHDMDIETLTALFEKYIQETKKHEEE